MRSAVSIFDGIKKELDEMRTPQKLIFWGELRSYIDNEIEGLSILDQAEHNIRALLEHYGKQYIIDLLDKAE